ncbi:MAG TPA: VOC family protein [Vicinamibacterales bacterium]|jgi:catechol 2,3-dioxygenase-like lactoylglutathione lyase family enzyme
MEHIITRLLEDFERGKMTRRQLVKSLALTATAASAAGAAPLAAEGGKGFTAVAVNHISYQVADYTKTRDWYVNLLGMKVSGDNGRQCNLSFGDHGTWLLPRNAREGTTAPKVDHIAYTIQTWDQKAVKAELERRGLQPREDTENSYHVKDPDGFDVQISGKLMTAGA